MSWLSFFRSSKRTKLQSEGGGGSVPSGSDNEAAFFSSAQEESNTVRNRGKRGQESKKACRIDPVLPEKKRARRRLVGALALVLAMVIGLPMVLDSEPKPLADDIAIQIPSKEKPSGAAASSAVSPAAGLDQNEILVLSAPAAPEVSSPTVQPPPKPPDAIVKVAPLPENTSASDDALKKESHDEAKLKPKAELKVEPKPAPSATVKPSAEKEADAARARAILEGQTGASVGNDKPAMLHPPVAAEKSSRIVIQVAALATQDKVSELQGKLSDAGIKSYTQKVATQNGERIRVRIGPFASKEEADRMREKLQRIGMNGSLVPS